MVVGLGGRESFAMQQDISGTLGSFVFSPGTDF